MMINKYIIWGLGYSSMNKNGIAQFEKMEVDKEGNRRSCGGGGLCRGETNRCRDLWHQYLDELQRYNNNVDRYNELQRGTNIRDYDLQRSQTDELNDKISRIKSEIKEKRSIRDAWRDSPEKSSLLGLGWSCEGDSTGKYIAENLLTKVSKANGEIERAYAIYTEKYNTKTLSILKDNNKRLNNELLQYEKELTELEQEIKDYKNAYETRKGAEKLALNNQSVAENAEEKAREELKKEKKDNTMLWVVAGIGLGACFFLFSGKDK